MLKEENTSQCCIARSDQIFMIGLKKCMHYLSTYILILILLNSTNIYFLEIDKKTTTTKNVPSKTVLFVLE